MNKKIKMGFLGAVTGLANGFFGSGGGIIAVPMLKNTGLEAKQAHACSLAVTLPLSAVSAYFYMRNGGVDIKGIVPLVLAGLLGAFVGAGFMKKISPKLLSVIFGVILMAAGIRGLFF
ncbi:MAG: sulfite exporter TauE/SafE family protein [Ruminococcus sp.]|nr:sulfite exporter TauE/SafE family protein [Ruminococcus sp.]